MMAKLRILACMASSVILLGGCVVPAHRYEYAKYELIGAGRVLEEDVELWNKNGRKGWRIVGIINNKHLILEREW